MIVVIVSDVSEGPVGIRRLLLEILVQNYVLVAENDLVLRAQGLPVVSQTSQLFLAFRLSESKAFHEAVEADVFEHLIDALQVHHQLLCILGENDLLQEVDNHQRDVDQTEAIADDQIIEDPQEEFLLAGLTEKRNEPLENPHLVEHFALLEMFLHFWVFLGE